MEVLDIFVLCFLITSTMGVALFGQLSVERTKEMSSILYDRATDSDDSSVFCLDFVGTIDSYDEVRL